MRMTCNLPDHAEAVNALLEGFVRVCQLCIESGLAPPDPTQAKVQYKLEPAGSEDWKLPQNVIRDGWGDCEDMAGWRAGGLRATGEDDGARAEVRRTGEHKLHCVVVRSDGSVEDPSRELWLRQPEGRKAVLGSWIPRDGIRDHREGGNREQTPQQAQALARQHAKDKALVPKVYNPETKKLEQRPITWSDPATATRVDAANAPLSTTPQAQQEIARQLQTYQWAKDLYAPEDAGDYYQGSRQDDGTVQYDDQSQYGGQQYGYGYGYGFDDGVDPYWRGPADWVDPRAEAAFAALDDEEDEDATA